MKGQIEKKDRKRGDKLEVKLRDYQYNVIYENEIATENLKQLALLINDLRNKGVPIDKAIEKSIDFYKDEWW